MPPYSCTFFSLFHRSPEGLRVQGSCATTTAHGRSPFTCRAPLVFTCLAHFPLRIRSKTFLNSDRASFFLLVWCVLCCLVARFGRVTVFYYAGAFNQDIDSWDVSAVTTMELSKCRPTLARSFPSFIDPRRDCVCKGRVPRRRPTAAVLSRAARLWSSLALLTSPCESVRRPF